MKLLESKVAIVTGGSRGIGKAICQSFAENGCDIALTYNNSKESAENLADDLNKMGVKAKAYKSDASSFDDSSKLVDDVMSDFGKIDIFRTLGPLRFFGFKTEHFAYIEMRPQIQ